MKNSQDVINYFIKTYKYKRFLEIGVRDGSIFAVDCDYKDGVDINVNSDANYIMPSDKFFEKIPEDQMYDIIFVDGEHEKSAVLRDIINSLKHLTPGGTILCHDVNPPSSYHLHKDLCNNAWETWAELRSTREDLEMFSLNVNMGPGIIRRGKQKLYKNKVEHTWEYLDTNRKELLNEITLDEFYKKYK